ncbi:MAG: hypothetical protein Q8L69_13990, partial [Gallionellaceae bacterium]|nr:hypothetical protein [Gallionellaceae bacterium]
QIRPSACSMPIHWQGTRSRSMSQNQKSDKRNTKLTLQHKSFVPLGAKDFSFLIAKHICGTSQRQADG